MRTETLQLLLRKQRLQSTIAHQREQMVRALQAADHVGGRVDDALQPLLKLGARLHLPPVLVGVASVALALWRPRRSLAWLRRGWMIYLGISQLRERWQRARG